MARTIRTKVYKFDELNDKAKENAIKWYNEFSYSDAQTYCDELIESVKAIAEIFDLKFGREYTDIRHSHIDDNILELQGIRLYKYIINNYYPQLFKPAYIKTIDRIVYWKQFICERKKGINGEYTQIYSKLRKSNSGVLTGMCYDDDILQPVYDFLKKPDKSTTFEDLIKDIENCIEKAFNDIDEWVNSDEYIIETIQANEYEFTADGRRF